MRQCIVCDASYFQRESFLLSVTMDYSRYWVILRNFIKTISLEPSIFLFMLSSCLVSGAELQTNLIIWKVCHFEFGYNETICENLDQAENEDIQSEVQTRVNNFQMVNL